MAMAMAMATAAETITMGDRSVVGEGRISENANAAAVNDVSDPLLADALRPTESSFLAEPGLLRISAQNEQTRPLHELENGVENFPMDNILLANAQQGLMM